MLQPVGIPLLRRLEHLVAAAADEAVLVQVRLLVVGQAGQVVERLVALAALEDGARLVGALVRQQLAFRFEDVVALEAGEGPAGAGPGGPGLLWTGLFLRRTLQFLNCGC